MKAQDADNRQLAPDRSSRAKRPRREYETPDVGAALTRQLRALGRRLAAGDPEDLRVIRILQEELAQAERLGVTGLRAQGHSDRDLAEPLGISRQAIQKRFPREETAS